MAVTLKSLGENQQYEYVNKTIENWPSWKKEIYDNFNSSSNHVKRDAQTKDIINKKTSGIKLLGGVPKKNF